MGWSDKPCRHKPRNWHTARMSSLEVFVSFTGILLQGTSITITDIAIFGQYGVGTTVLRSYAIEIGNIHADFKRDNFHQVEPRPALVPSRRSSMSTEKDPRRTRKMHE